MLGCGSAPIAPIKPQRQSFDTGHYGECENCPEPFFPPDEIALGGEDQRNERKILTSGKHTDGAVFHPLLMNIAKFGRPSPKASAATPKKEIAKVNIEDPSDRPQQDENGKFKRESPVEPEFGWHFRSAGFRPYPRESTSIPGETAPPRSADLYDAHP